MPKVAVEYRAAGTSNWRSAMPLVRVDYNGANMLAGSIPFLSPERDLRHPADAQSIPTAAPTVQTRLRYHTSSSGARRSAAGHFHVVRRVGRRRRIRRRIHSRASRRPKSSRSRETSSWSTAAATGGRITFNAARHAGGHTSSWQSRRRRRGASFAGIDIYGQLRLAGGPDAAAINPTR